MRRRPPRVRRAGPTWVDLNVTSMTDMFTLILIFLLMFFDPNVVSDETLSLPVSTSRQTPLQGVELTVSASGISVGSEAVTALLAGRPPESLSKEGQIWLPVLDALRTARGEEVRLTVRCDRAVVFSTVDDLLVTARAAGFTEFRFLVSTSEG